MPLNFLSKHQSVIIYGASLAALLFLLKWLEWQFIIVNYTFEIYAGFLAVIFTALGIWLGLKLTRPKTTIVTVEKTVALINESFILNERALNQIGISKRELEVLTLMAQGLSNQEIAGRLFVSLNTIKTHSSKVFEKLEVQRRTQAIEKAKRLSIIP